MSDKRLRRVNKEIADCKNDKSANINIHLIDNSPFHLRGSFDGPQGTSYEGGHFEVDIVIPDLYPFYPIKMKFITKVYHPNVIPSSGSICVDIFHCAWSPAFKLHFILIFLQSLLHSPEPSDDSPDAAEVAKHYTTSRTSFEDTARHWTHVYAGGPAPTSATPGAASLARTGATVRDEVVNAGLDKAHVDRFEAIGFERSKVIDVLRRLNYRGANVTKIPIDIVIKELLEA